LAPGLISTMTPEFIQSLVNEAAATALFLVGASPHEMGIALAELRAEMAQRLCAIMPENFAMQA
jgi:hypothetical protein